MQSKQKVDPVVQLLCLSGLGECDGMDRGIITAISAQWLPKLDSVSTIGCFLVRLGVPTVCQSGAGREPVGLKELAASSAGAGGCPSECTNQLTNRGMELGRRGRQ